MREKIAPTREDRKAAAIRLARWMGMNEHPDDAAEIIREILEEYVPGIETAYAQRLDPSSALLSNTDLPQFLVDMMGAELFEGKSGGMLRRSLLQKIRDDRPEILLDLQQPAEDDVRRTDPDYDNILKTLATRAKTKWVPGGGFARRFVDALGIPPVFAGYSSEPPPNRVEEVYPRMPYVPLECFQENMKAQILEMLRGQTVEKRAIVSLPTGAGKTRTVAEAIVEFWRGAVESRPTPRFVMWISQTNELGEQAVACFKQLWEEKGTAGDRLSIFRTWRGRGVPYPDERGIVVAGIDQLYSIAKEAQGKGSDASDLAVLGNVTGAVFIDEAHRSWAPKYLRVLKEMGIDHAAGLHDRIPLIGLTATPERTARGETGHLRKLYGGKIIHPNMEYRPDVDRCGNVFDDAWSDLKFMRKKLTELGFLARAKYHWEDPARDFMMSSKETDEFNQTSMLSSKLILKIGSNPERNNATYRILKKWIGNEGRQILFFGASVSQALLMSRFLEDDGFASATITSNTKYGTRKAYVRMFGEGAIRALCNYEVLATGFDAPKIDTVIIARPTRSRIVYQQMVGRGLRGPNFGGTESCDIVTLEDCILTNMGRSVNLGYMEYRGSQDVEIG